MEIKAGASQRLNTFLPFCKIVSANELTKMFLPCRDLLMLFKEC